MKPKTVEITPSIIKQVDLARATPRMMAGTVGNKLASINAFESLSPYEIYWWMISSATSIAHDMFGPESTSMKAFKVILQEATANHYASSAIDLGLVSVEDSIEDSKDEEEGEEKKDGLSDKPELDRQEQNSDGTPVKSRLILLD